LGTLLHESWKLKKTLTYKITNDSIDEIYHTAKEAGAIGGKLLGAGGGGFILFIAKPELHELIKQKLENLLYVPFKFENTGSSIIFYQS
jgi:D-glycero-alpha-D-manno-heptose-7-phosphate kinase